MSEAAVIRMDILDSVEVYNRKLVQLKSHVNTLSTLCISEHALNFDLMKTCNLQKHNLQPEHAGVFLSKYKTQSECLNERINLCCLPSLGMDHAFRVMLKMHSLNAGETVHVNMAVLSCYSETILELWINHIAHSLSTRSFTFAVGGCCNLPLHLKAIATSVWMSGMGVMMVGPWMLQQLSRLCGGVDILMAILQTHVQVGAYLKPILSCGLDKSEYNMAMEVAILMGEKDTIAWMMDVAKVPLTGLSPVTCSRSNITGSHFMHDLCESRGVLCKAVDVCLGAPRGAIDSLARWLMKSESTAAMEYIYFRLGNSVEAFRLLLWRNLTYNTHWNVRYYLKYIESAQFLGTVSMLAGGDVELLNLIDASNNRSGSQKHAACPPPTTETLRSHGDSASARKRLLSSIEDAAKKEGWPGVLALVLVTA